MKKTITCILIISMLFTGCSKKEIEKKKKYDSLSVDVKDLTAPIISLKEEILELHIGDSFKSEDFLETCTDNMDKNIKCSITGEVDISTPGTYKVKYAAKDSAGNVSSKILSVIIKEKVATPETKEQLNNPVQENKGNQSNANSSAPEVITPPLSPLSPRKFLFSEGYTMPNGSNPATTACIIYMGNNPGNCWPVYGSDGLYVGMEYTP